MPRDELIDALRGLALFGILAVNIQSFVWGVGSPSLGVLQESSHIADVVTLFLTALLLEYKFYPLFCFCFGYGFAVQTRRWVAGGADVHLRFTRRMNFMLILGILHGVLLWFGDILARYAIAGYLLRPHIRKGPRALMHVAVFWLGITVVTGIGVSVLGGALLNSESANATQSESAQQDSEKVFETYTEAGYIDATIQRAKDFFAVMAVYIFVLPQVMLLFLLGALAAQLKLLRYAARYRSFWQRVFWIGLLAGLPINFFHAISQVSVASNPWMPSSAWEALLATLAPLLAFSYVAAFALARDGVAGTTLIRWLAPAGRAALTLYISQSVLMMLLLNGFGFALGFGATFGQFELFVSAVLIYMLLLVGAHLMQRFAIAGPLEGMWRRYTNTQTNKSAHTTATADKNT